MCYESETHRFIDACSDLSTAVGIVSRERCKHFSGGGHSSFSLFLFEELSPGDEFK